MDVSYWMLKFLRQPSAALARRYLGIPETTSDGGGTPGSGDVVGPASATAGNLASFGDGTGKLLADSGSSPASIPTANQKAALAGTNGAPAAGNPYVTDSDPRNTNARTPTAHAASHSNAGSDAVTITNLAGFPGGGTTFLRDDATWAAPAGSGTVTSVDLAMPTAIFDVAGGPIVGAGTLTVTFDNQNANLVFAGPSSGGAAAPTMRSLVEADTTLSDITTNDATSARHGYCPKLSNVSTEYLDGTGAFSTPSGGSDWDTTIVKSADQTVTNNATPQNDSELSVAVATNTLYLVELLLLYAGNNTTGDYRGRFTFPDVTGGGTAMGWFNGFNASLTAVMTPVQAASTTAWPNGDMILGTTASSADFLACQVRFLLRTTSTAGTLQYQFANSAAALGRDSITKAGSTLRIKAFTP